MPENAVQNAAVNTELFDGAAYAFRGYNITNLGRTGELLAHAAYGPIVERHLREASQICAAAVGRSIDLVDRVARREETTLETYDEAVTLTVSVALAQLELLKQFFDVEYVHARLAYGYSLGEITALVAGGVMNLEQALAVPLAMAGQCVELAHDVTLGVLFSRGPAIDLATVDRLCLEINTLGQGVIGVSAYLAPNSVLLMGQGDTIDRFGQAMPAHFPQRLYLRKNEHRWPPMHTPIVWQRAISNRAAVMMHTLKFNHTSPIPPVFSLVTGNISYDELNCRQLLTQWIDHPQRLWDAVYETLVLNIKTVVHVGAEPNLIPATFKRLSDNVSLQTSARSLGGLGLRAVSSAARQPWLKRLLPGRSALLRAPFVRQIILEDWLLEQTIPCYFNGNA